MFEFTYIFSVKNVMLGGILTIFPLYQIIKYIKTSRFVNKELMHFERHNCVVMCRNGLVEGWPCYGKKEHLKYKGNNANFAPILYFIDTATKSLDIAIMTLNIHAIEMALINAAKRNVRIRLILECDLLHPGNFLANLIKLGVYNFLCL